MRQQFINDGIENFDFHTSYKLECRKLSQLIFSGGYVPQRPQRILVEKSKGLCRQLVIPSVRDAIILQCLSDALYAEIRNKAPTKKAFFEPKEHRFSNLRSEYGTFASWLNFQRELFNFSKTREFIVITDIANYYDSISYVHLRNVISSMTGAEECVLDMLIYILSDLLWQPDYTPRFEVGLPQINLDAPRLLAHCFLYELDAFLASDPSRDFVRYMDDIDIGVDTIVEAKQTLKAVDLVLHTKHVRLNSGKTMILSKRDALKHFRVVENARLDQLKDRVERRLKRGLPTWRDRRVIQRRLALGIKQKAFDSGNGEKILKRLIGLAIKVDAKIQPRDLEHLIRLRPSVRENVFVYIRSKPLSPGISEILARIVLSGILVDDAAMVDLSNHLVETKVVSRFKNNINILQISDNLDPTLYFGFYCKLWLQSKYERAPEMLDTIEKHRDTWVSDDRLGRLVGSLRPLFVGQQENIRYINAIVESRNSGASETYRFQSRLSQDKLTFDLMYDALKSPNPSRGTAITHSKFLCLLSALSNSNANAVMKATLRFNNTKVFDDIYYRSILRRLGL